MDDAPDNVEGGVDLGWKMSDNKNKRKKRRKASIQESVARSTTDEQQESAQQYRRRLLKELSARLTRDRQLRYAERELEMQRLLMGKGRRRKVSGVELVHGNTDEDEDEDEIDARKGRAAKRGRKVVDEKTWKPRVYKWKIERRR